MLKKLLSIASTAAMLFVMSGLSPMTASAAVVPLSQLLTGDLIRGESFPAVYYLGEDGFRYVFPNDKTFFTWYGNFDSVKWISDEDLGKIQIGGNVTYKPGTKMIKIDSDPKTYAIGSDGELRWVTTEEVAIALYGGDWNTKIDDVPDAFFSNYHRGADIETASDFDSADEMAAATDINEDKDLQSPILINITDNSYNLSGPLTIDAGRAVRFTNKGAMAHTATATDLNWGTGTMNAGDSFERYFDTPGTYDFFCSYHPTEMTGELIVQ